MNFLGRLIDVTMKKQQESMQSFEGGSFLGNTKSLPQILEDILKRLPHHFGDSMGTHIGNIGQHLTENSQEELTMQQIEGPVDSQQGKPFAFGKEDPSKGKEEAMPCRTEQGVEQKDRMQEETISVVPSPTVHQVPVASPQVKCSESGLLQPIHSEGGLIQATPERNHSKEISFDLKFDISTNQRISYLQKITTAVSKKQEEYLEKSEPLINKIMSQRQPETTQFLTTLSREFGANLEQKMLPHVQNLHQYLFPVEGRPKNLKIEKIVDLIQTKQGKCLQSLSNNFKRMCEFELEIDTDRIVERKVRREEVVQVVVKTEFNRSQNPVVLEKGVRKHPQTEVVRVDEVSHEIAQESRPLPATTKIEHLQAVEVVGSEIKNPQIGTVPLDMSQSEPNIIKTRIISRPHENLETRIQPNILATSDVIVKRDIVKELEERRRKIKEHELQSKKLKTKLIRLEPIASKEQRLAKEKEARQKINAAVDFVQNLDNRKKSTYFKITEWKQEKNHRNHEKTEFTPNKYNNHTHLFNGEASHLHDSFEGDSYINSSLRVPSRGEKNFTLRKPVPYNLYSVNFKEHQLFKFSNK